MRITLPWLMLIFLAAHSIQGSALVSAELEKAIQFNVEKYQLKNGLTVRQAEELVAHLQNQPASTPGQTTPSGLPAIRDMHVVAVENKIRERFGTKVQLRYRQGKGSIEVKFFSEADLDRILNVIGVKVD